MIIDMGYMSLDNLEGLMWFGLACLLLASCWLFLGYFVIVIVIVACLGLASCQLLVGKFVC